jgi:DNA repair exonuclease SbcCD ATPase subunit
MGRIHVRRITLQAFRAFQNKQSTYLLPLTGLVGIRGKDLKSGVSSGTGKSSIPLAITYALGFCPFPATQQQNWHTKLPMQVELELDTPQGPAILRRGKEFSLTIGGKTYEGSAKAVETEIRKLTGLPPNLLEALSYRQQQERGRFLKMTDAEKKEFLGVLLGAGELEEQIANSVTTSNKLQVEVDQLVVVIEALAAQLVVPSPPAIQSIEPYRSQLAQADVELMWRVSPAVAAQAEVATIEAKIVTIGVRPRPPFVPLETQIAALKTKRAECVSRVSALTAAELVERKRIYADVMAQNTLITQFDNDIAVATHIERDMYELEAEIRHLGTSYCPTCKREWAESHILKEEKMVLLREAKRKIALAHGHVAARDELKKKRDALLEAWQTYKQPNLEKLVEVRNMLDSQIAAEQAGADNAKRLYDAEQAAEDVRLRAEFTEPLRLARQKMDTTAAEVTAYQKKCADLELQIKYIERTNTAILEQYNQAMMQFEKSQANLNAKKDALDAKRKLAGEEADYEVLVQISNETNELLRGIPNTPTTTVTFVSEAMNAKGVSRQEIKPVIIKNGQQIDLKSGISGGQLESVELAVDLSIARVIGQRTGVRPGFMIFDESFSAHCMPVKEACLQVLQKAAEDCLILVVDHATELRDYFTAFIDVTSENDVSSFAV